MAPIGMRIQFSNSQTIANVIASQRVGEAQGAWPSALWPNHHTPDEIALMKPCMARSGHRAALIGFRH
jgi:hypothetical protein